MARRQLDKRLSRLPDEALLKRPPKGWVKAVREALGMTTAQLAKRMGVSQPRITDIEKAEVTGGLTLETLERTARALNCDLVYVLAPRKPLDKIVEEQALKCALQRLAPTRHTMALEAQSLDKADEDEQVRRLARTLVEKPGSHLWEDQ